MFLLSYVIIFYYLPQLLQPPLQLSPQLLQPPLQPPLPPQPPLPLQPPIPAVFAVFAVSEAVTVAPADVVPVDAVVPFEYHADADEAVNATIKNNENRIAAFFLNVWFPIH